MGKTVSTIGDAFASAGNYITNPANITRLITDPVSVIEDGVNGLNSLANDLGDSIEQDAEDIGDAIVDAAEAIADAAEDLGDELDEAFSKDGVFTRFVEDNLPGGGFFTAIAHAAAGNEEHAQMAALKGVSTALETGFAVAGAAMGGPLGGALGGAMGAATKGLFEGAMHDLVPENMQHRFKELDPMDLLVDVALGAATGALGAGKATKEATDTVLKNAAKEGIEDLTGAALKQAVSRQMAKDALVGAITDPFKDAAKDAAKEAAAELAGNAAESAGIQIPQLTKLEAIQLMTQQAFENRIAREFADPSSALTTTVDGTTAVVQEIVDPNAGPHAFRHMIDPDMGEYWLRDGMVVWSRDEAETFELHSMAVDRGYESVAAFRADVATSWAMSHDYDMEDGSNDYGGEWKVRTDDILGDYMIKDGKVVWGVTNTDEAEAELVRMEVAARGFDSVDDVRADFERRQEDAVGLGRGTSDAEWTTGTDELLGDYMIKNGEVVWGATSIEEAEERYVEQELDDLGFGTYDNFKEEFERSYKISHEMAVEADRNLPHEEWTPGNHRVLGDYMIRNGEIVWGAKDPDEAEAKYAEAHPEAAPIDDDPDRTDPDEIDWSTMTREEVEAIWAREDAEAAERAAEEAAEPEVDFSTMTREEVEAYWAEQDEAAAIDDTEIDDMAIDENGMIDTDGDGVGDTPVYVVEADEDDDELIIDDKGMIDTDGDGVADTPVYVVEADEDDDWDTPIRTEFVDVETPIEPASPEPISTPVASQPDPSAEADTPAVHDDDPLAPVAQDAPEIVAEMPQGQEAPEIFAEMPQGQEAPEIVAVMPFESEPEPEPEPEPVIEYEAPPEPEYVVEDEQLEP